MSTRKEPDSRVSKIKYFFLKHETKLVLFVGFMLISTISFEIGVLQGQKWQQKPLLIEKQVSAPLAGEMVENGAPGAPEGVSAEQKDATMTKTEPVKSQPAKIEKCAYVGSKNSTKFYAPNCSWAKQIKPENVVCFASADEALRQGRTESKCN